MDAERARGGGTGRGVESQPLLQRGRAELPQSLLEPGREQTIPCDELIDGDMLPGGGERLHRHASG